MNDDSIVLTISHSHKDGDFVIPVHTTFKPNDEIISCLSEDMFIGIKGYVTLDREANIMIVAEKITIASKKAMEDDTNESN